MRFEKLYFQPFYNRIISSSGVEDLFESVFDKGLCGRDVKKDFMNCLQSRLQQVCLRTLITEMHIQKDGGSLEGRTPKEEYEFFCTRICGETEFVSRIFEKYPVLKACVDDKICDTLDFYKELLEHFRNEKEEIEGRISGNEPLGRIVGMKGEFSDTHNRGKQVLELSFENGRKILYKPRSMENERHYARLLSWISDKTGISQKIYPILSYGEHSWCAIVPYKSCATEEQLQNYYLRIGSQLFLAYILGTKDLHFENIIASGEYPVLVDLETLVNIQYNTEREAVDEEIRYQLSRSVLFTGLLPFYVWNRTGEGIDSSGLHGGEPQRCPFKVPVVADGGTSDMRIEYRNPWTHRAKNRALLNGEYVSPHLYVDEVLEGFTLAYQSVLEYENEFCELISSIKKAKSRYLVADTQRYSMLLSGSYHPGLLGDEKDRDDFLRKIGDGRRIIRHEIVDRETEALKRGDIPYFFYDIEDTGLQDYEGFMVDKFFLEPPEVLIYEKIRQLGRKDLAIQQDYIKLALLLVPDNTENFENRVYSVHSDKLENRFSFIGHKETDKLKQHLMDTAVWNRKRTQVSWTTIHFAAGGYAWEIRPMNYYLYSGLAGMLLLFYELQRKEPAGEAGVIYQTLQRMLFEYTDWGAEDEKVLYSRNTGAYEGESSIAAAYLLLYKRSKQSCYLSYAEKHAEIAGRLLREDKTFDLLSGNAGAARIMLLLYKITGKQRYLEYAESAIDVLDKNKVITEKGTGWSIGPGIMPMTGMAHGTSGILMAVIELWAASGNARYGQMAEEIWQFENAMYDEQIGNWIDTRGKKENDENGPVAWCHGAGGILLSRLSCYGKVKEEFWKRRMMEDIRRAWGKLEAFGIRDSISLCHGNTGNRVILEYARKQMFSDAQDEDEKIVSTGRNRICEKIDPGIMNGYGGVLYRMICEDKNAAAELLCPGCSDIVFPVIK